MGPRNCLRSMNVRAARRAVLMAPIVLTACQPAVLDPQGPVGLAQKTILIDSLAIMLAIVVPTIAAILAFAWWFRASNARARYLPDLALIPVVWFDGSRHADQGDLDANAAVGRENGRLLVPMSGHFVVPVRGETRCEWLASDV